jgi:hypothetical protein
MFLGRIGCIGIIFFIIAFTSYLVGCYENISPYCANHENYNAESFQPISHRIITKTCYINDYPPFACFFPVISGWYGANHTCELTISANSYQDAINILNTYSVTNFYTIYVEKSTRNCSRNSDLVVLVDVGLFFFGFTCVVLIVQCILGIMYWYNKKKSNHYVDLQLASIQEGTIESNV